MINVNNVDKNFGRAKALREVSLGVGRGEVMALLGLNGAGKTTLMKCIMGILNFAGKVRVDGLDVKREGKIVRGMIGYVPQTPHLYEEMRVEEVSRFFARLKGVNAERCRHLLRTFGLEDQMRKKVASLSGGMKQRLSLAVALLSDPPILLLDEPTANLDARGRADFIRFVNRCKAEGKTMIVSSHRIEETEGLADRVVILEKGEIILNDPIGDLIRELRGRTKLNVELLGTPNNGLMKGMEEKGFRGVRLDERCLLIDTDPDSKMKALRCLEELGSVVKDFSVEQPSLEQIILELTERYGE